MTKNKEDYLKAIYNLGGENKMVSNKNIAEELKIAPASVTEMLARMKRDGLIESELYKGTMLTEKGLARCLLLVRSHRLWEVFLMKCLEFSWDEAHEEAHLLEHAASKRMVESLDKFLNYPQFCPHGSAIPSAEGSMRGGSIVPLSAMNIGESAYIRKLAEGKEFLNEFLKTGLVVDDLVKVASLGNARSPYVLCAQGILIKVDSKMADKIFVDIVSAGE